MSGLGRTHYRNVNGIKNLKTLIANGPDLRGAYRWIQLWG